ncbi:MULTISPECIES: hypothetical protein [Nocardia]|uniref:hypothetical protein n=1 Tax=Nocardia TaxID=1817 RepID=UPI0007A54225|nr:MULTISPECIES: hypothetical protein [Nocardia]
MKIYEVRRTYEHCDRCGEDYEVVRRFSSYEAAELFWNRYCEGVDATDQLSIAEVEVLDEAPELVGLYKVLYSHFPDRRTFSAIQAGARGETRTPVIRSTVWNDELPPLGLFHSVGNFPHTANARALTADEADRLMDEHISLRDNGAFE